MSVGDGEGGVGGRGGGVSVGAGGSFMLLLCLKSQ